MQTISSAEIVTRIQSSCPKIAEAVVAYILENFSQELSLDDLATQAGLSRFNFCRRFQRECGLSPMRWLWNFRTLLAAEFIALDPKWSLTDVAFACGFSSSAHFSRSFKAMFKQSPSVYRRARLSAAKESKASRVAVEASILFDSCPQIVLKAATDAIVRP